MEKWKTTLANKESKKMEHHSPAYYLDLFERYEKEKEKEEGEGNKQKIKDAINYIDIYIKEVERIRMYLNGTKRKMQEVIKDTPEDRWPKRK